MNHRLRLMVFLLIQLSLFVVSLDYVQAGQAIFSDSTFDDADWSLTKVSGNSTGQGSVEAMQSTVGGNPGPYRETTVEVLSFSSNVVGGNNLSSQFVYDPSVSGAIEYIDVSYDRILISTSASNGAGQLSFPLLVQDGTWYVHPGQNNGWSLMNWQTRTLLGLREENWISAQGDNPDFSADGSAFVFGFQHGNSTGSGINPQGYTTVAGYDNLTFTFTFFNGDVDEDGDVDGLDFLEIQRGFGTLYDDFHLSTWEAFYGTSVAASATTVPEPTTCTLALIAHCLAHRRRR